MYVNSLRRPQSAKLPRNPREAEAEVRRLLASGQMTEGQFETLKAQAEGILALIGNDRKA